MPLAARALALGMLAALSCAARAVPPPATPALALTPCELEHPLRLTALAAECGVLKVPEDPARPQGRQIGLAVARVAAINRRKQPDPLFVLAGGPGQGARDFYTTVAPVFARILRERDIVLLDQRGTGGSNRLDCAESEELGARATDAEIAAATRSCLKALSTRADVTFYTTSFAVSDLERLRAALGYAQLNLYGVSYGTRVAQQYLRHFPQRVRSVILDGVVPTRVALGLTTALDAEHALDDILARCRDQSSCRERFGDPQQDYHAVRKALAEGVALVSVADPSSGESVQVDFSSDSLAAVLRLGSYSAEYAAILPLLLHAGAANDFGPLASQYLLVKRSVSELLAGGMHNSVVCSEDLPFLDRNAINRLRLALATTYMGATQLDGLQAVCRIWPRGAVDADLHAPLDSPVPALLLAGGDDPVTAPPYAREAARSFPHGRTVLLEGFGHGQLTAPCMDRVMAQFLSRADPAVELSCLRAVRPLPFFTSLNGPPP